MSVRDATDLEFPVLTIDKFGDLWVYTEAETLQSTNSYALGRGLLDRLLIVEPSGQAHQVRHARVVGPAGPLMGFRFLKPRRLKVVFTLETAPQATLDDVQRLVLESLERDPHPWDGAVDIDVLKDSIRQAPDIGRLLALLHIPGLRPPAGT
jgi:hypothetical protein